MTNFPLVTDGHADNLQAVPVRDAEVVHLVRQLLAQGGDDGEAVELLRQVVTALTMEREDRVSRVEGNVQVDGPVTLDTATLESLALLLGQLEAQPQSVTFDQDSLNQLKEAIRPRSAKGGGGTRRVEMLNKAHQRIDPATEGTLQQVRDGLGTGLAQEATLLDAVNNLSSILTDLQGKRDGTAAEPAYTSSPLQAKIGEQKVWMHSSRLAAVAAGSTASWQLANPADSTVSLHLFDASAFTNGDTQLPVRVYRNSTMTGATAQSGFNPILSLPVGGHTADIQSGADVRSAGDQLATVVTSLNVPYEFEDGLIIIPPGVSLEVEVTVPSGLTNTRDLTVGMRWYEE